MPKNKKALYNRIYLEELQNRYQFPKNIINFIKLI